MAEEPKKKFSAKDDLTVQENKDFEYAKKRIKEMQDFRTKPHYGVKLNNLWSDADRDYVPHRLKTTGKRVVATDEEKGWRGSLVTLGDNNWQSDIAQANPFIKIQTAQSILVDQNPTGVFTATNKKFEATNELIRQLYQRSWEFAKSKQQLKLFIHNLSKYGWATGRTYPLKITRKVKVPKEYNPEDPNKTKYDTKEVVEYNDIFRENLDPRNTWIDDMTRPNNLFSLRDWCYRKVYAFDSAEDEFGKYDLWKKVTKGGNTGELVDTRLDDSKEPEETDLVEIYFYENKLKDLLIIIANGVPIVIEPLPVSDLKGNKRLSLWQTYWNLRHAESPYGIGIYEAIRYDNAFLDRIRNMTIDQLTLSIYKMFFYTGTAALQNTGDIKITPGVGKQVLNPKDINWLEVPGPGRDAFAGIEMFKNDVDESSGITKPLIGEITGKTAFELAQAKESALKRLKTPLENILDALDNEGYITVYLIQLLYSIPEVVKITNPSLVEEYLREIQSDPELFQRDEEGTLEANIYPEFPLNLEEDEQGSLVETAETSFFRIKPSGLKWEGIINIKSESVLAPSKQIEKALGLEMYNILIPLLIQPPEVYAKAAKNIIKLYEKDPKDILPDHWLVEQPSQPFLVPAAQAQEGAVPVGGGQPEAEQFVPNPQQPQQPQNLGGRIVSGMKSLFR